MRRYRRYYKKVGKRWNKSKTSYLRRPEYKRAEVSRAALDRKIYSVKSFHWDSSSPKHRYRVDEIGPFHRENGFWQRAGGAIIDQDIHTREVFVRGGQWTVTLTNTSNNDSAVEMYLAFLFDGTEYESLTGTVEENWHPHLSEQRFHECAKLSKFRKSIILKAKDTKKYKFKLGYFSFNVAEWFSKKRGWPLLYVVYNGANPDCDTAMKYLCSYEITFVEGEDSRYAISRDEMQKFAKALQMLKDQMGLHMAGVADTTMDHSAQA